MDIYYKSGSEILCFRHAVERANKGEHVNTRTCNEETDDCGMSGSWYYPECVDCENEE